ncbi:MAG: class A beta-lactamase-related serine hydrolase [Planctomycetota bacterium]|nr:MAG: class A beta-lactamase-related serine hydrolase [Planctomycetota bacterium]
MGLSFSLLTYTGFMITRLFNRCSFLAAATLLCSALGAQDLDTYIQGRMNRAHVPGLSACIVKDGSVVWAKGYGYADLSNGIPVDTDTAFLLASVSKTVTATAVVQLADLGWIDLDDDISAWLPLNAQNPRNPGTPIRFRQLLSHAAAIQDNWDVMDQYYVSGDSPVPLGTFLADYLIPGGANYVQNSNWYAWAPGQGLSYSNIGMATAGYMVEAVTGSPFDAFCETTMFSRLGMNHTSWFLAGLQHATIALPYEYRWLSGQYVTQGHYGFPDYPDGQLRSSVEDLAQFLIAHAGDGSVHGVRILSTASVAEMRRVQYPQFDPVQGLGFYHWHYQGEDRIGHDGGEVGAATLMWYRPADGVGVIVLSNGSAVLPFEWAALVDVVNRLFVESEQY